MPATATFITGTTGQAGPEPRGTFSSEIWRINGAASGNTTITITPNWLRQIAAVLGPVLVSTATGSPGIVNNPATGTATATFTFPALVVDSSFYVEVLGFWR